MGSFVGVVLRGVTLPPHTHSHPDRFIDTYTYDIHTHTRARTTNTGADPAVAPGRAQHHRALGPHQDVSVRFIVCACIFPHSMR